MNWSNAFQWWDMKRKLDIDNPNPINIEVFFSTGPHGHGINDCPTEVIERIYDFYKTKNNYKEVEQILNMCEKWMPKDKETNDKRWVHLSRYKEEQIYLDWSRKQIWSDVFPEWKDLWLSIPLPKFKKIVKCLKCKVFILHFFLDKSKMSCYISGIVRNKGATNV